jgi:hypothetical protein
MYDFPDSENVVRLWHLSPSKPAVHVQLARWSVSPTNHGVHVPPLRQATLSHPVRATEQFLPP